MLLRRKNPLILISHMETPKIKINKHVEKLSELFFNSCLMYQWIINNKKWMLHWWTKEQILSILFHLIHIFLNPTMTFGTHCTPFQLCSSDFNLSKTRIRHQRLTSLSLCTFNNLYKQFFHPFTSSSSIHSQCCQNLQADHHSHPSLSYCYVCSPS
jgi:hypothetical protein